MVESRTRIPVHGTTDLVWQSTGLCEKKICLDMWNRLDYFGLGVDGVMERRIEW